MLKGLDHYVEVVSEELSGRYFITGFHGVGYVGWIAVRHLVEELGAKRIGYVLTRHMQPFVSVKEGIVLPYELYKAGDAVFLLTNVPLSKRDSTLVPLYIAERVAREFEETILVGGLDSRRREGEEELRIAPTKAYLERHPEVEKKYRVMGEGLGIVGPLAVFLAVLEARGSPGVALLPYAAIERPDPKAAAKAVEVIGELLGLEVDVKELIEEGVRVEKTVEEIERKIRESMKEREAPPYYI